MTNYKYCMFRGAFVRTRQVLLADKFQLCIRFHDIRCVVITAGWFVCFQHSSIMLGFCRACLETRSGCLQSDTTSTSRFSATAVSIFVILPEQHTQTHIHIRMHLRAHTHTQFNCPNSCSKPKLMGTSSTDTASNRTPRPSLGAHQQSRILESNSVHCTLRIVFQRCRSSCPHLVFQRCRSSRPPPRVSVLQFLTPPPRVSALPFLTRTQLLLYPLTAVFLAYLSSLVIGWNLSQGLCYFYKYRVVWPTRSTQGHHAELKLAVVSLRAVCMTLWEWHCRYDGANAPRPCYIDKISVCNT